MRNSSVVAILFAVLVATWSQSLPTRITQDRVAQGPSASPRYLFRIPVFSGTELFESNPDLADLSPPFGTVMEVFHTTDGRPLDKEAVLAFYRDALEHNGWKSGVFSRPKDEAYLSMRTDVFETLPDGTHIQIAGSFYLWMAPLDGMITVYLRQWRISSIDQVTHDSAQAMEKRLIEAAPKVGYRAAKVSSDGKWKTDFENEYLVDRVLYALVPSDAPSSMDAPEGTLIFTLLTYRDADLAAREKARREREFLCTRCGAAVRGKILVTIEGDAAKEKRASVLRAITLP